jgi:hypothetical protein
LTAPSASLAALQYTVQLLTLLTLLRSHFVAHTQQVKSDLNAVKGGIPSTGNDLKNAAASMKYKLNQAPTTPTTTAAPTTVQLLLLLSKGEQLPTATLYHIARAAIVAPRFHRYMQVGIGSFFFVLCYHLYSYAYTYVLSISERLLRHLRQQSHTCYRTC